MRITEPNEHSLSMRISRARQALLDSAPTICSERAVLITEAFRESEDQAMILRRAKALAHILTSMQIYIEEDQLIVGNQASVPRAAPIFPEYSVDWIVEELDQFENRSGDVFLISENTKEALKNIHPYWHGKTHQDAVRESMTDENILGEKQGVIHRGGISMSGDGHIIPNHEKVLAVGFNGLLREAEEELTALSENGSEDSEKRDFYQAVRIVMQAAIGYANRYASLARRMAANTIDPARKIDLQRIAKVCDHSPAEPAHTFHEALQTVYFCHLLMMIESNGHSFSFGRFDQYMLPFFNHDLQEGRISEQAALELIALTFIKFNSINKVRPWDHTEFGVGYPLYSNLMVGGIQANGEDGTNPLSYLTIRAVDLVQLPEPNFSVRFWEGTPHRLLEESAKLIRKGFGMPSMFADETVIPSLMSLGIDEHVARDYASMGCVEVAIPGRWGHRTTGMTYLNFGKILELVLYNGVDPETGIQIISIDGSHDSKPNFDSYDQLFSAWKRFLQHYTDLAVESDRICDASLAFHDKDPFASALIDDCLMRGKTLKEGGARYDFVSHSTVGPVTVGDSLMAMKKAVFDDKSVTFPELMIAIGSNWEGDDGLRIQRLMSDAPKFGNDIDEVDTLVADVFRSYLDLLPAYDNARAGLGPFGCGYTMSTSNISSNVPYGLEVGATPDGRCAGMPLNEGASPCRGADLAGPTAVVQSIAKLPNRQMAGGQLLNMKFSPDVLAGEENLSKFVHFLEAFRLLGGFHIQFNVIDAETLKDAKLHPDLHQNLMVRVAGYCALFTSLMPEVQDDIIMRTEHAVF